MVNLNEIESHINHFRLRAHRKARAHYLYSKSLSNKHIIFGIIIIIITTTVGSSVVFEYSNQSKHITPLLLGLLTLLAAVLSSFQTFFGFSDQAVKHKTTASQYNMLYRKMSLLNTKYLSNEYSTQQIIQQIENIQADWSAIELKALDVPDRLYDKAKKEQLSDSEGV